MAVAAGAHPGHDDRAHFGRRELALSADELRALLETQLRRISAIAEAEGVRLAHVKPHGALYNLAARDREVADIIAAVVRAFDPSLVLYGLSASEATAAAEAAGLRVAHEAFAERAYDADGRLAPRGTPGAVFEGVDAALLQVRTLLHDGVVIARDGTRVPLRAETLCLHGDRPDAAEFARALRLALETEGITVEAPG